METSAICSIFIFFPACIVYPHDALYYASLIVSTPAYATFPADFVYKRFIGVCHFNGHVLYKSYEFAHRIPLLALCIFVVNDKCNYFFFRIYIRVSYHSRSQMGHTVIKSSFILLCISITLFIVGSLITLGPLWNKGRFGIEAGKTYVLSIQYQREYKQYVKKHPVIKAQDLQNKNVPVLLYHSVLPEDDGYNVTLDVFKEHMFALKQAGYQTITVRDLHNFLTKDAPLPPRPVLITFDDGSKTSFYPVDPLFRALGFRGTQSIITRYSAGSGSGGSFYLSEDELRYALGTGRWEILSHGHNAHEMDTPFRGGSNHFLSQRQFLELKGSPESEKEFTSRIMKDFTRSRHTLESAFSLDVLGYSFPFGDFGQNNSEYPETEQLILDAASHVYTILFHQARWKYPEPILYKDSMYMVPRITVHTEWSGDELLEAMANYMASGVESIPHGESDEE